MAPVRYAAPRDWQRGMGLQTPRMGRGISPEVARGRPTKTPRPKSNQTKTTTTPPPPPPKVTGPKTNVFDYRADPDYLNTVALNQQEMNAYKAWTTDQQKRLLLGFGSQALAQQILGNDPFVNTISSDPANSMSTLAQIARSFTEANTTLNNQLNDQNLWYSSHRANELARLGQEQVAANAQAEGEVRAGLGELAAAMLSKEAGLRARLAEAERLARERAREEAAANPPPSSVPGPYPPDVPVSAPVQNLWDIARRRSDENTFAMADYVAPPPPRPRPRPLAPWERAFFQV